jgi:hypothetical protein
MRIEYAKVFTTGQPSVISLTKMVSVQSSPGYEESLAKFRRMRSRMLSPLDARR